MTQATHTQGPWIATQRGYKSIVNMGAPNSAEIIGPSHADNARLIAAAPDLLAACEEMAAQLGGVNDFDVWEAAKAGMIAAIAKAKGA